MPGGGEPAHEEGAVQAGAAGREAGLVVEARPGLFDLERFDSPALGAKRDAVEGSLGRGGGVAEGSAAEEPRRRFGVGEDRTRHDGVAVTGGDQDEDGPVSALQLDSIATIVVFDVE